MSVRHAASVLIRLLSSFYSEVSTWRQVTAMLLAWTTVLSATPVTLDSRTSATPPLKTLGQPSIPQPVSATAGLRPQRIPNPDNIHRSFSADPSRPARPMQKGKLATTTRLNLPPMDRPETTGALPRISLASLFPPATGLLGEGGFGHASLLGTGLWPSPLNAVMQASGAGSNGISQQVAIFGAQQYVRTTGAPNQYSNSFSLPSWVTTPFELHIQNGDGAGGHRISSGTVLLNGIQVVGAADLSQQVATIDRSVSLVSHNTLQVTLASVPGSYIIITVSGQALPIANAGPDQTVFVGTRVQLDGSASTDPDGDLLTYQWSLMTAPTGSTAQLSNPTDVRPTITIDKPGNYVLQLVVSDGTFSSSPSQVTISTRNSAPVAIAGNDQKAQVGVAVQLDGSKSHDVDGDPLTYKWTLVLPPGSSATLDNPAAVNPKFTPDVLDDYYATLVVNDGHVDSQPSTVKITSADVAPVADAGSAQTGRIGQTITLDGTKSSDADGQPITYQWSFTSKPANSAAVLSFAASPQPTFVIDQPGHYALQLIVNDGFLPSAPASTTVDTVNSPPVANAGIDQTTNVNTTVQLDGSKSYDVDSDPLTYHWSLISVPSGSQAILDLPPYSARW